ncbi:hypothetical protein [Magnetospirillum sp. 15-1]|uniref:hypothetical protein n=1 Tax=Magnetospirillum sp. 15-1 TaxID=1979370 RepID=UPI0011440B10|nr:hypothetical protein [Magnetospirillum sp. 15-1]
MHASALQASGGRAEANKIRDTSKTPNSLIGGAVRGAAESVADAMEECRKNPLKCQASKPQSSPSEGSASETLDKLKTQSNRTLTYSCLVYCDNQTGATIVDVQASNEYDAAKIIGEKAEGICQQANYRRATSMKMRPSQCKKK